MMADDTSSMIRTQNILCVSLDCTHSVLQWRTAIYQAASNSASYRELVILPNDGPFIKMICYNANIHKNTKNKGWKLRQNKNERGGKKVKEYIESLKCETLPLQYRWSGKYKGITDCPLDNCSVQSFRTIHHNDYRFIIFMIQQQFSLKTKVSFSVDVFSAQHWQEISIWNQSLYSSRRPKRFTGYYSNEWRP